MPLPFDSASGGTNLGTAVGLIRIDVSGVRVGIDEAKRTIQDGTRSMGDQFKSLGKNIQSIGLGLTALSAPITGFLVSGIRVASQFDSAMSEISARTGLVGDDLERVKELALEMGSATVFSAQQSADAFLELLSSGQSAAEAIETLPVILDAAAAGGMELGHTADIVTDIMASFQLEVSQSRDVVDALARASASSSADMNTLGQGFANVGPVANQFGLSVEQTSAILATFAENGIKGAEAGTQLKSMLLALTHDTPRTTGAWEELGISLFDARGEMRDLDQVIVELDQALDQLPMEDQIRLSRDLGGSYGIMGLQALRAGVDTTSLADALGTTITTSEQMFRATGALSEELKTLPFDQQSRELDKLREAIRKTAEKSNWDGWKFFNQQLEETGITVENFEDVLAQLGGDIFGDMNPDEQAESFRLLSEALRDVGFSAGDVATGPIAQMIATMNGQASASDIAKKRMDTFQGSVNSLKGSFETLQIRAITPFMENGLKPIIQTLTQVINAFASFAEKNSGLVTIILTLGTAVGALGIALTVAGTALSIFSSALSAFSALSKLSAVSTHFMTFAMGGYNTMASIATVTTGLLTGALTLLTSPVVLLGLAFVTLGLLIVTFGDDAWNSLRMLFELAKVGFQRFAKMAGDAVQSVAKWFGSAIQKIGGWISKLIGLLMGIPKAVNKALDSLKKLNKSGEGKGGLFGSGIGPNFDPIGGVRDLFSEGGRPRVGQPQLIGAQGPEIFVPDQGGNIVGSRDTRQVLSGGGGTTINNPTATIVLGDIGDKSPEQVKGMVFEAMMEFYQGINNG